MFLKNFWYSSSYFVTVSCLKTESTEEKSNKNINAIRKNRNNKQSGHFEPGKLE